jgi:hypothetical protein
MVKQGLGTLVVILTLVTAMPARATDSSRYDDATYGTMLVDGIVVRPLGIAATIIGAAGWVVTLPFSLLGGNAGGAADALVMDPARFTFTRPLGEF